MTAPLPGNVDIVRVRGHWFSRTGGGSGRTITFEPLVPVLTDAAASSYITVDPIIATPDHGTAYFYADLIASNDPDLTPSAWRVTFQDQDPFTISVDYNATVQDVGDGVTMKAIWLASAPRTDPPPPPVESYYTSAQTDAAIVAAVAGFPSAAVASVAGRIGDVVLAEGDITGLVDALTDLSSRAPVRGSVAKPNGTVTGSPGDVYSSTTGGPGATLWVKETGAGTDIGWVVATPLSVGGAQCVQPFLLETASAVAAPSAGNCNGTAFVADRSLTVSNFIVALDTAQVGGSLFRLGLYTVASDDTWTLVARSSGNATDAVTAGVITVAFNTTGGYPASYVLSAGGLYGIGVCHVGSSTAPVLRKRDMGIAPPLGSPIYAFKRSLFVSGGNECPATIAANTPWSIQLFWFGLT